MMECWIFYYPIDLEILGIAFYYPLDLDIVFYYPVSLDMDGWILDIGLSSCLLVE